VVVVAQAQPSDVVGLAVVEVEPAEDETLSLGVDGSKLSGGTVDHRVALHESGDRATRRASVAIHGEGSGLGTRAFEAFVDHIDVVLFGGYLLRSEVGHADEHMSSSEREHRQWARFGGVAPSPILKEQGPAPSERPPGDFSKLTGGWRIPCRDYRPRFAARQCRERW
jgi:hypothetical protein